MVRPGLGPGVLQDPSLSGCRSMSPEPSRMSHSLDPLVSSALPLRVRGSRVDRVGPEGLGGPVRMDKDNEQVGPSG